MNILSEEAHNFLSDNVEGILLYSIVMTVVLLIVFFRRSKIRSDYKKWKKWKFKVFGISGQVEKNEDKMFEELWEENEKNTSKITQLSKQIKEMSNRNIIVTILFLAMTFLLVTNQSGWRMFVGAWGLLTVLSFGVVSSFLQDARITRAVNST